MRGEVCVGFSSILSFVSLLLLIFVHVGQINVSTIPRKISMVRVDMSQFINAVQAAVVDVNPVFNLYTADATAPLRVSAGLRQTYEYGLYDYCAYVNQNEGICTTRTGSNAYTPFDDIIADIPANFSQIANAIIPQDVTFRDSRYLSDSSTAAYIMLLLGTICVAITFITGVAKHKVTFFLSSICASLGSILLLASASTWTVMIQKTTSINTALNPQNLETIDIFVHAGHGLFLLWAAFACLCLSIVPYLISCCTYRG